MGTLVRPNIYEYLDFRSFLRDMFVFRKQENSAFSFRMFSRTAHLKSSNFLKLVMEGKRNLSSQTIQGFAQALKLSKEETDFFENLARFGQAQGAEEKSRYYEKIVRFKSY